MTRFAESLIHRWIPSLALGSLFVCGQAAAGQTESVIYRFCSLPQCADGFQPKAGLIMDVKGNLYGTTVWGGANGVGTVFEVSPSGSETVLHNFANDKKDGAWPEAGLLMDAEGNLYGTTVGGGAHGGGTVLKLRPDGAETVLYSFRRNHGDGYYPQSGLIADANGNLYGTTYYGGASKLGTAFKISTNGTETILHSFAGSPTDGAHPSAGLIMDKNGNLYGTTTTGGTNCPTKGCGTVFMISADGTETLLHSFAGHGTDGYLPAAGLIMDDQGNLYGTTANGGTSGYGTVFEVSAAGVETVLHDFCAQGLDGCTDGSEPAGGLLMDAENNLYGTTVDQGPYYGGTIFELSRDGTETILYVFNPADESPDGASPEATLVTDADGNLYGTTVYGGAQVAACIGFEGCGVVFKVSP